MKRLTCRFARLLLATVVGLAGVVGCVEGAKLTEDSDGYANLSASKHVSVRNQSFVAQAFADESDNSDKSENGKKSESNDTANDVVEAAITISPSPVESENLDQTAQDKKRATDTDTDSNGNASSSNSASPVDETNVSTDFGLPADSPLFSGVEEDVEVASSKKSADVDDTEEGADTSESSASDEASLDEVAEEESTVTFVPDENWLERGNAVLPLQLPDSSFIYDTSIQELSNADPYLDNQTVQVTGEAIGDSIRASIFGRSRWITLSPVGNSATVSVFMSEESAAKIDAFGRYGVRGTILRVRGTFYLVCPEHDGATDLHAEEVTVVKPGESVHESFNLRAFIPGIILVVLGIVMFFVFSRISERRR